MWRAGIFLISALLFGAAAQAETPRWLPDRDQVARLEAQVKPPKGYRLNQYDRSYSGTFISGRKVIEGRWVQVDRPGQKPKVEIVPYHQLPDILDGGCSIVTVQYDVATAKVAGVTCNGLA